MATRQIAVRLDEADLSLIDEQVTAGRFSSRAEAVREALRLLRRAVVDAEIAEAYDRLANDEEYHAEMRALGEASAKAGAKGLSEAGL